MIRLFTGISLPRALCDRIHLMQGGIEGARWTAIENYHITLNFIGDVDETGAEDIDEVLSKIQIPKFELALNGTGSFSQGDRPTVLWLGLNPCDALSHLKDKIDRQFEMHRISFEKKKYTPHITMAYLKDPDEAKLIEFMQTHNLFTSKPFAVDEFVLFGSKKTKHGVFYDPVRRYALV